MKKKLFLIPLALGLAIGVASCGEENTFAPVDDNKVVEDNTPKTDEKTPSYTIKVYDIDDALLGEKTLKISDYPTVFDGLVKNFDVEYSITSYGPYLTQINKSIVDSNYYLSILENGSATQTGIDGLEVNDGDVFEFKNELNTFAVGGTFDDYDILVDKIIYHYAKGKLRDNIQEATTYLGSTYWDQCFVNLALTSGFDSNAFDVKNLYTDAFKQTVSSADVTNLPAATEYPSDANIAKWYYSARAIGYSLDAFITPYTNYLEGINSYTEYSEFVLPFTLSIAKGLNLDSKINSAIIDTTYRAGTTYGIDGISWQLAGLAEYKTLDSAELDVLTLETINNSVENFGCMKDVSLATILIPYAAMNLDARGFKIDGNNDVLKYLLDNCFDKDTYQFDVEKTPGDKSSSQIYASLMAYKASRDTRKAAYLFA